jgi:hypothetical protein
MNGTLKAQLQSKGYAWAPVRQEKQPPILVLPELQSGQTISQITPPVRVTISGGK